MKIGKLNSKNKTIIIAEIGNNHEGNFNLAKKLVTLAAENGADIAKFQTIIPEKLVNVDDKERIKQLNNFKFSFKQFELLKKHCDKNGIYFMSTPFSIDTIDFLNELVPAFKISSGDLTFIPLIDKIIKKTKPILLSTGLSSNEEIKTIIKYLKKNSNKNYFLNKIMLLHCVSSYPTKIEQSKLEQIYLLKKLINNVGYSDHVMGINACLISRIFGATVIEKHFTIDKNYSNFRDHQLSCTPSELKYLRKSLDEIDLFYNSKQNTKNYDLKINELKMKRSIVYKKNLKAEQKITINDLDWLRPGKGLPPTKTEEIIGKKLKQNVKINQLVKKKDFF